MTLFETLRSAVLSERPVALATVVSGAEAGQKMLVWGDGSSDGTLGSGLDRPIAEDAVRLLREERHETRTYAQDGVERQVFIETFPAPPQIIIVGATHVAIPLSSFAKTLGYRVIVTDARGAFATEERFPAADRVVKGWPQDVLPHLKLTEATYVVLLSHDPKFDEPTLDLVLPSPVPYIGAIGSRKTQGERFHRLQNKGYTPAQLARIYGPVGLDLGGRMAEETALAIISEITAVRRGGDGTSLRRRLEVA